MDTASTIVDIVRAAGDLAKVAEAAGLSRPHLNNVILGKERLSGPACVALADALGVEIASVAEQLGGEMAALRAFRARTEGRDVREALS